ncbi:MAG TPA: TspO/MBR family protein [Terracidiphilus sp.]|nr:TspO/MBR family protein [Terracidiphilus sp.]
MRWISLGVWLGICFAVAAVGGRWTAGEIPAWYRTLTRPSFAPPNWVFGPVWSLLYLLMGIAAWRVWESAAGGMRTRGLTLFLLQLGLNLAWSWIFFHRHAIGAALVEVAVLWMMIGITTMTFAQVDRAAGWMMAPYWAWVTFATALNAGYWRLN